MVRQAWRVVCEHRLVGVSAILPCATGVARRRDGAAEVSRGRRSRTNRRKAGHGMPDGGLAFRWWRQTQVTGLRWPVPGPRTTAGSRQSTVRARQTPRQGLADPVMSLRGRFCCRSRQSEEGEGRDEVSKPPGCRAPRGDGGIDALAL